MGICDNFYDNLFPDKYNQLTGELEESKITIKDRGRNMKRVKIRKINRNRNNIFSKIIVKIYYLFIL
jgi:hypothetical protein